MKHVTLLFLRRDDQILLAMKKRGFGVGKWNGTGGKIEPGESILQAAIRECQEEIGVTPKDAMRVAQLRFFMPDDPDFEHHAHVFVATSWQGEPIETKEMRPEWFALAGIPFAQMWPDDIVWLPHIVNGKLAQGIITVSETELVSHDLEIFDAPKEVQYATIPAK